MNPPGQPDTGATLRLCCALAFAALLLPGAGSAAEAAIEQIPRSRIVAIDRVHLTFTVKSRVDGQLVKIRISPKTRFYESGIPVTTRALEVGRTVSGTGRRITGENYQAVRIDISVGATSGDARADSGGGARWRWTGRRR